MGKATMQEIIPTPAHIIRQLADAGMKPPREVTLAVTNQCNLRCRHCWLSSGPDRNGPGIPKAHAMRLMDDFSALGAEKIIITGGEPLTHPDWFALLSFACRDEGFSEVRLQTNAILLTQAHVERLQSLVDMGLIVQTSLEGATAKNHERVRGQGSFRQTLQGLKLLVDKEMAPHICITFTEMQHNFDDLPELMKTVEDMGIRQFITGTLVCDGRAAQSRDLSPPTADQYDRLIERYREDSAFRQRYRRIGNIAALEWAVHGSEGIEPCCTFIETPYVTAKGKLHPCLMLHAEDYAAANLFERPLMTAVAESIAPWSQLQQISRARRTDLDTCQSCPDYAVCGAGCMGRAYSSHKDFFTVEDRCHLRKVVYRRRASRQ